MTDRKQVTEIDNCKSSLKHITTGVPQGSILGPFYFYCILMIIYSTELNLLSFADDTTVYYSGPFNKYLFDVVNCELIKIYEWLCTNRLLLNIKKTKVCIFGPPHNK